jgi:hypothetical protein
MAFSTHVTCELLLSSSDLHPGNLLREIDYNRNKEVTSTNNPSSRPISNGSREAPSLSGISNIAFVDIRQICDHKWSIPTPRYHIYRTRKSIKHSKHKRHIEQIVPQKECEDVCLIYYSPIQLPTHDHKVQEVCCLCPS